jgi:hypothetical protein
LPPGLPIIPDEFLSPFYRFSAILNFAERARLFSSSSISEGKIGFLEFSCKVQTTSARRGANSNAPTADG